jgi:hypothetical protein
MGRRRSDVFWREVRVTPAVERVMTFGRGAVLGISQRRFRRH